MILPGGKTAKVRARGDELLENVLKKAEVTLPAPKALTEADLKNMSQDEIIRRFLELQSAATQVKTWNCKACSYLNAGDGESCVVCDTPKSQ